MTIISKEDAKLAGLTAYFTGVPCLRGHLSHRNLKSTACLKCSSENMRKRRSDKPEENKEKCRKWYAKNREYANNKAKEWIENNRERYYARWQKYRASSRVRAKEMVNSTKWSAKQKNLPHDLTLEWIKTKLDAGVCEITGIPFVLTPLDGGLQNPYTASLDRIIPSKGYVMSNVRMILWALNAAFNSYGEDVYAEIAKVYLAKKGLT